MAMTCAPGLSRGLYPVEGQVEFQDIDARGRADDRPGMIDHLRDQSAHLIFRDLAFVGNATNLVLRGFWTDVGVKT